MSLKEINATTKFLKWTDLKARIQDATIVQIRHAIAYELTANGRDSILRMLVSRYNALQARENQLELAQELSKNFRRKS
jgi:hypothetical protein